MKEETLNNIIDYFNENVSEYSCSPKWDFEEYATDYLDKEVNVELIKNDIIEQTRWAVVRIAILKVDDKYVSIYYRAPATESQEGQATFMEATQVEPYEKTVTEYKPVE